MTVEQLIKELADYDPDTVVCIENSDGLLSEISLSKAERAKFTTVYGDIITDNVVTFRYWRDYES